MDEKVKRLKNWMEGNFDNPITIELNPTHVCNANCLSCWLREFKPKNDISNINYIVLALAAGLIYFDSIFLNPAPLSFSSISEMA